MNGARRSSRSPRSESYRLLFAILLTFSLVAPAGATTQLTLTRGEPLAKGEYSGVVELVVDPGFRDARVTIIVDGQKIADGLRWPHRVTFDLGPTPVEHVVTVNAVGPGKRRVQWHETLNRGHLPLSVKLKPVDLMVRLFEAETTVPKPDVIAAVEVWHHGKRVVSVSRPPFRFEVPEEVLASGFVQVTARTGKGEEAADFWSPAGAIHVESIQVRTVPLYVSVVDRNGATHAEVDQKLFRIMDNGEEGKILEFGSAFEQPISIALLLDSSASMTYQMAGAAKAAQQFVTRTLKPGDRCSVTAVQSVPRRKQSLTEDSALVLAALETFEPDGSTALYDAIATALRELQNEERRRAIVILTDGGDTDSMRSFEEVEKTAVESGIPLYFIAWNTGGDHQTRDFERLRHLAAQTGGFAAVASAENLQARYRDIERDLRAQFAILYQVTDFVRPREWRRVRVTVASPKLTARTISGYFTP